MKAEGESQKQNAPPEVKITDPNEQIRTGDEKKNTDSDYDSEEEEQSVYRPFDSNSWDVLNAREAERKKKEEEKKNAPQEGRLVDGELKFGDEDEADDGQEKWDKDPALTEGNVLPPSVGYPPKHLLNVPLEEIDPFIKHKSFVVITSRFKKKYIHRFSATRAFFLLTPWNPIRRFAVWLATNQFFDYFIIFTILFNCVCLALPQSTFTDVAEYVFTGIYTVECLIKLVARGLIIYKYTYLRDSWNILDIIVIISAYVTLILEHTSGSNSLGNISSLRTFRVLRALKTVSIVPGLKTIISALLKSLKMLGEVILLTLFCMMVFALFALQVYVGVLRQKCVADIPPNVTVTPTYYNEHIKNPENWYADDFGYVICGNASGAGVCPGNYTCLPHIGDNPNFGYTNFDHIGWSMLNSFQLITLDFWEDPYAKVLLSNGPWNMIFFSVIVFFGSFYLINLMLAVVSMSYEEEATNTRKEKDREKEKMKKKREAARKRKNKKREEKEKMEAANHLTVMSAVNSGSSASSVSLKSVGNGSIGHHKKEDVRLADALKTSSKTPLDSAKMVDEKSSKNELAQPKTSGSNQKGEPKGTQDAKANLGIKGKQTLDVEAGLKGVSESGGGVASAKDGPASIMSKDKQGNYVNPLATITSDDTQSISSEANDGDPPQVMVKVQRWPDSDSEDFRDDDDDELVDRNCECCGRCCQCYIPWLKFQNGLNAVVSDFMFEIFITFCIVLNVISMAIYHHDMSQTLENILKYANWAFTAIFTLEAILKLMAFSKHYFRSAWNNFDMVIVFASLIDLGLEGVDGLSVIRGFRLLRLLRIFKLAQTWSTMRVLLSIILSTLGALGNLTLVLLIIIYIFAVIGMQLFSTSYTADKFDPDDVPRWNFSEFFHSLILIFRVLCGEWIEPLWDCMRASGELCMVVFLPSLVIGNFMVLNLFLALLLNSFASDSIRRNKETRDDDKMKKGWKRLKGIFKRSAVEPSEEQVSKKPSIANIILALKEKKALESAEANEADDKKESPTTPNGDVPGEADDKSPDGAATKGKNTSQDVDVISLADEVFELDPLEMEPEISEGMDAAFKTERSQFSKFSSALGKKGGEEEKDKEAKEESDSKADDQKTDSKKKETPSIQVNDKVVEDEDEVPTKKPGDIEDCFPMFCMKRCCTSWLTIEEKEWGRKWIMFRKKIHKITEHKVFEYTILFVIFASSLCLCFEDIYLDDKPGTKQVLQYLDIVFVVVFVIEMLMKWIAIGFKKYFTSFWTILDFCIVIISLVSLAAASSGSEQISSFRALRTLRALRPLRAISRWQGMRIVVNALVYAIPAIVNVLLVCLVFWLIFSIAGVQLFGGKFYKCVDDTGERVNHTLVPDRATCENNTHLGYRWLNSKVNFDNVITGYLALFQVATFEGWMEVMDDAVDSTAVDEQPRQEASFHAYWFFVTFIIVGSFFTLNLFISVIVDNFNMLKKKYEGGYIDMLLTQNQKNYYNTMKKLGARKPQKTIKRPKNAVQRFFFDVSMSTKFELAIVILIFLNMAAMAVEHYNQSVAYTDALDIMNIIFTTIFTLEAIVKIIGMRWHYFRRAWNVFDFIIVILSVVGVVLDDILRSVFVTPSLLRVVRVFRIGRVLRLIKAAKGIRKLLFALVISLPALFNIAMLLFLLIFIYAIFGMTTFGNVKLTGRMDNVVNFQTFGNSILLLFRLTTAAGWNDILEPLMLGEPDCDPNYMTMPDGRKKAISNGDCGNSGLAVFYMVSFVIVTYLIIINMYIAVILENFSQAHEQEEVGITEDDFEMFYVIWERYDPHATQFIKYEHLSDFVADLDQPLGMAKPNEIALVAFDLPIYEGDRLHCLDILTSLVKHVLGGVEDSEEFRDLKSQMEEKHREAFPTRSHQKVRSSTMRRKKEDVAAKTLQRCWRKHKAQKSIRAITQMAMEASGNRSPSLGNSRRPSVNSGAASRRPSVNTVPASPRPGSSSSQRTIQASSTAQQKKMTSGAKTLQVPTASDIRLPSDHDVQV